MTKSILTSFLLFVSAGLPGQAKVDLDKSVPLWIEIDTATNGASLQWINDDNTTAYTISSVPSEPNLIQLGTTLGTDNAFNVGPLIKGQEYAFHVRKSQGGIGIIRCGIELPAVHERGRCMLIIDSLLNDPLETEIAQWMDDAQMDGWHVNSIVVSQEAEVVSVKQLILNWYDENYDLSHAIFLLGHIPVPYSGNSAHDGHNNHQGAWAADLFYGDVDGFWRDVTVNNTSPSRDKNKNVPFDGKYDQTLIPSDVDIEVGRVDFNDLPAFEEDEIELTRQYLIKNHEFRMGNMEYPRRALIENNFGNFGEGFGQSGWRNFTTMFKGDSVSVQNYDVLLESDKYLCSYACGGGSYTSCSGVGTTANLWVAKDIQTVFTMTFGSYFGDWDSQNNFLRSALASGDVLTNAWSGRPIWQFYHMATGKHIGYSTRFSQNATGNFYGAGFSSRAAHIALMGDPTLRLHAMKGITELSADFVDGDVQLDWKDSPDQSHGYFIYRKANGGQWELLSDHLLSNSYTDLCVPPHTSFEYMVKAIRLEETGSGSYFNTSLGKTATTQSEENPEWKTFYSDADMDGYGDPNNFTESCALPPGFVDNLLDCDDTDPNIHPHAEEIANNGIDEDCDGADLLVSTHESQILEWTIFPNPATDYLQIEGQIWNEVRYQISDVLGHDVQSGMSEGTIDIESLPRGLYYLKIVSSEQRLPLVKSFFKIGK